MELDNLVTQENSDEGVWFQAVIYGKKQQFDIKIFGQDSDVVQKYNREHLKRIRMNKGNDLDDELMDSLLDDIDENVIVRMGGLRSRDDKPLILLGRELKDDKSSFKFLIEKIPAVKNFVLLKSNERTNFLHNGKKN